MKNSQEIPNTILLLLGYGIFFIPSIASKASSLTIQSLEGALVFFFFQSVIMVAVLSRSRSRPHFEFFPFQIKSIPTFLISVFFITLFLIAVNLSLLALLHLASQGLGFSVTSATPVQMPSWSWWGYLPFFFLAALREELFFRWFLLEWAREKKIAGHWAVLAQALVFGSVHIYQGPVGFILAFFCGLGLGWFFWNKKNLPALVAAHTLYNLIIQIKT